MKIDNKRELQNVAINQQTLTIKIFWIFTENAQTNQIYLTIGTAIPADNPLCFRKKSFRFIMNMVLTDEFKILDDKIKANHAEYNFHREAAKISALLCKELDKYQYLTGED